MTTAIDRLAAAAHRPGTAHLRDLAIGIGPISLADALEILATVERLHGLLEARCEDHYRCQECGAVCCEACHVGEPAPCSHHHVCLDHFPVPGDHECEERVREETTYAKNDRPWGAPA